MYCRDVDSLDFFMSWTGAFYYGFFFDSLLIASTSITQTHPLFSSHLTTWVLTALAAITPNGLFHN